MRAILLAKATTAPHSRLAIEHMAEPVVGQGAFADDPSDPAHRADDQQRADIGLPHFADRAAFLPPEDRCRGTRSSHAA